MNDYDFEDTDFFVEAWLDNLLDDEYDDDEVIDHSLFGWEAPHYPC